MSLLAPIFLLGALAVALPVLFHLIRRSTREKTPFSSLMFLMPSPPRLTRRSRLEHLLLLLLRCLVLCLLALAFSRPFIKKALPPAPPSDARRMLILVDTSASMRRPNLWSDAKKRAESILRDAAPADEFALYTFDRQVKPLVTFDEWKQTAVSDRPALALRKLSEASPGWSATMTAHALTTAAETLSQQSTEATTQPSTIVLITDLQEGSHLDPLQGYEWPKGISVSVETLKPKHVSNASLQLLPESEDAAPNPSSASVRVRVSNSPGSKIEQFKVRWAGGSPLDIYVPAGQSRIVSLPIEQSGSNPPSSILLSGDEEDFDNTLYVIPPEPKHLNVLYFGTESEKEPHQPLYFLERGFQETRRQIVQVLPRSGNAPDLAAMIQQPISSSPLIIATDLSSDSLASTIHDQIAAGKTLLLVLKTNSSSQILARLLTTNNQPSTINLTEAHVPNYAMLGQIDFQHPLFAPFADPRFSDFTKIHFWKYRKLDASAIPSAHVLARFDNDDPAMLEVPLGKGRVIILTSSWQPDDSQLALSSKFVPFLYSVLDLASPSAPAPAQYFVGDAIPSSANQEAQSNKTFVSPGIFTLASQPAQQVAVNLDPAESRTTSLAGDELERRGVPIAHTEPESIKNTSSTRVHLQNVEMENRQKLWRWCILVMLALVLMETWLAGRTTRRALSTAET